MNEQLNQILADVKKRLELGQYKNEEHVRLAIVLRILFALGWDIWNPEEVYAEFPPVSREDRSKVDLALFTTPNRPAIFIEVKAVGKLLEDLVNTELQVRDYNRNISALFCIITDGRYWRIYYTFYPGEFSEKCFRELDIMDNTIDDLEFNLRVFVSKNSLLNGVAERDAKLELQKSEQQRTLESLVPQAARRAEDTGCAALEALIEMASNRGIEIDRNKAGELYQNWRKAASQESIRQSQLIRTPIDREQTVNSIKSISRRKRRIFNTLTPDDLVPEVILALQNLGGKKHKSEVENLIYKKYENLFSQDYYQIKYKNNQIKWRNMIEWARERAKQQGFIKPPGNERGVWELTEKGKTWRP